MSLRAPSNRDRRGVLSIKPFRRLWVALALSSLGDWLSILALTALAFQITSAKGVATQSYAVGGVWIATLLPALILGPLAGAVADRLDRRMNMIVGDVVRGLRSTRDLLAGMNETQTEQAVARLRATLAAHETSEGVFFDARTWIIAARRP